MCLKLCRVLFFGHTAKNLFVVLSHKKHTTNKKHTANPNFCRVPKSDTRQTTTFVVCQPSDTRRSLSTCIARVHTVRCRLLPSGAHGKALFSPCASCQAHDEAVAAVRPRDGRQPLPCVQGDTRQRWAFAMCLASSTRQTKLKCFYFSFQFFLFFIFFYTFFLY